MGSLGFIYIFTSESYNKMYIFDQKTMFMRPCYGQQYEIKNGNVLMHIKNIASRS